MAVKVLGPMETGEQTLGPRERAILAALIVRRDSAVSPAELAEAWWGENLPSTWAQQIRNSVARIRSRLGKDAVQTVAADYRLGIDAETVDAVRFERLVSDARGHGLRGEDDRAIDAYRRALGLWRGPALQDLSDWDPGIAEAGRLAEIRASAEEELLDARLRAGEHRAVIADAERLVRADPLREDRWAILALANYRADRQAEALATVRAARTRLDEELGIEPGARLTQLEVQILTQDPALAPPEPRLTSSAECPYPGLRAYGPDDTALFFGREHEIDNIAELLRPGTVVVIAGPSGSGKSSLALAGVVARVRASGRATTVITPDASSPDALRSAGERAAVVVIDQAEEIQHQDVDVVHAFADAAWEILQKGLALLFTVRSDSLDRLRALPRIGDRIGRGIYLLGALSREGCLAAIDGPARTAGLRIEPGLVELAVRDVGDSSSTLPHLSHALRETWLRREGATLTVAGYEASGGIAGAIAQTAEDVYRSLAPAEQAVCRSIMLRLIDRGADGISTRRRVPSAPMLTDPLRRAVIERLARARLVSVDADTVMIAHEAVASAWPRLDGWLDEDVDRARVLRMVEEAAAQWDSAGREDDDLLRGARLHLAGAWREASDRDLTELEADFLDASNAHEASDLTELQTRAARERSRNRVLRFALGASAVLLVGALAAGGIAVVRSQESASTAEDARIGEAVATSLALRSSDMELAALVAAEAYTRWPTDPRVRSALLGVVAQSAGVERRLRAPASGHATYTAVPYTGTAVRVTDVEGGATMAIVEAIDGSVLLTVDVDLPPAITYFSRDVWLSDDNRVVAVQTPAWREDGSCCVNRLTFVDLIDEEVLSSQDLDVRTTLSIDLGERGEVAYLGHPLTGSVTAIDTRSGTVRASDPSTLQPGLTGDGRFNGVAVIDDALVAVSSAEGVLIIDRATLSPVRTIDLPEGTHEGSLGVIADDLMITGGQTGASAVNPQSGERVWTIEVDGVGGCGSLGVMGDGSSFVCAGLGDVREYDSETGTFTGRHVQPQLDWVVTPTVLDDDTMLLSAPQAAMTIVWSRDGAGIDLLTPGRAAIDRADSRLELVPTADLDDRRLWDIEVRALSGPESEWMAWVGDGILARRSGDAGYTLENLTTGTTIEWEWRGELSDADPESWVLDGDRGPHAFVVTDDRVIPFDPETGEAITPPLHPKGAGEWVGVLSVSETSDGEIVAVTWWNADDVRTETTTFDVTTGAPIANGLHAIDSSVIVGHDILSAGDERLDISPLSTLEPERSLSRPVGGSRMLTVSDDGRTAMNVGYNGMITLYDLERGIRLADPIAGESIADVPAGFLAPDGLSMVVNTSRGVTRWTLDPAEQYVAACAIAGRELTPQEWTTYFGWAGAQDRTCSTPPA